MESDLSEPRRGPTAKQRVLLLFLGGLAALFAVEVAVRFGVAIPEEVEGPYSPGANPGMRQGHVMRVGDPELLFALAPNARAEIIYPAFDDVPERHVVYETNAAGFRDRPFEPELAPGSLRVAVLGDSFTHGNGLHLDETFPKVMERALREADEPLPVEVLNCGIGGYNTPQQVAFLKKRVAQFEPDVVLIAYYVNDVLPPFGTAQADKEVPQGLPEWPSWLPAPADAKEESEGSFVRDWIGGLARASRLVSVLVERRIEREVEHRHFRRFDLHYTDGSPGWTRVERALAEAAEFCESRGIELFLTIYPNPAYPGRNPFGAHESKVVALAESLGIQTLDVFPVTDVRTPEELVLHPQDRHGSPLCNELIGVELARLLRPRLRALVESND